MAQLIQKEIYSNQALHEMLAAAVAGGHLCHAYLFYGAKGIGKKTLALRFAATILCRSKSGDRPCLVCSSCKKMASSNHPDFFLYEGKSGANSIHIDTVRAIRQDAYILPNESDYKVYVIPNAEDMSQGAANALLKVLEEPPSHAVFLLTANRRERVPETIRSRCIQMELYPMSETGVAAALRGLLPDRSGDELSAAAAFSDGVIGKALDYLTDEDYTETAAIAARAVRGISSINEYELLAAFSSAAQSKQRMMALLDRLGSILRTALFQKVTGELASDSDISALGFRLTTAQIDSAAALLEEGRQALEGNVNLSLLANRLTVGMIRAAV